MPNPVVDNCDTEIKEAVPSSKGLSLLGGIEVEI